MSPTPFPGGDGGDGNGLSPFEPGSSAGLNGDDEWPTTHSGRDNLQSDLLTLAKPSIVFNAANADDACTYLVPGSSPNHAV